MLCVFPVCGFQLARYLINNALIFRCFAPLRYDPAERFGNTSARVVLFSNGICEVLNTQCTACPSRYETDRFTANPFAVAIFANPDAQFRACVLDMMKSRQSKETPAITLPHCEYQISPFGYRRQPGLPDAIEARSVNGGLP